MGYLDNCDYQSSPVGKVVVLSRTEPNISRYRPGGLPFSSEAKNFLNGRLIISLIFLSYLSYGLKSIKMS